MIEVLVALLILSIGLLGLAGLQTRSIQMSQSAHQASQATYLAYDIIDRMRSNRVAALAGDYDRTFGDDVPTGNTLAAQDTAGWLAMLQGEEGEDGVPGLLPMEGDQTGGAVAVDGDGIAHVRVGWFDARWLEQSDDSDEGDPRIRVIELKVQL